MTTDEFGSRFRRWRRGRPFWGGLFLLLSGLFLFLSANMSLISDMKLDIHIGPQGFLSYVLPVLMILCGVLVWFTPAQRMFYGIVGLLTALYSFIGLNFGGWFLGMLFGIIGGALAVSWSPAPGDRPDANLQGPLDGTGPAGDRTPPSADDDTRHDSPTEPVAAGHDDRPEPAPAHGPAQSDPSILPGFDRPRDELPGPGRSLHRKALAIIVVPALVGGVVLIGSRMPASAEDCPAGLPSISISATPSASTRTSAKSTARPGTTRTVEPTGRRTTTPADPAEDGASTPSAPASASTPAETGDGNPVLDGLQDVVDGVGNLLGIGDDQESPAPSASPSASATSSTPTAAPTPTATTTTPATGATGATGVPSSAPVRTTGASPAVSASVSASADPDVIPCLGPRQRGLVAEGAVPQSAIRPGIMKVAALNMYDSTYEGVADVPTADGPVKSLQFNMSKAVNTPFSLTIDEPGDATTVIKSRELITEGNVKFYTPKFTGKLFGLIPVTFTPEQPPPLTLPWLLFTDVTIDLAYVSCDTLTAKPLQVTES
ncbi:DUF6114 domain-containing protein [Actinoplanes teichomyceticus]|uniref:Uncharacterized protein n=1 Tax=Actinoplanes teichomyceticus TaxID=1867 RepID=A0A561WLR9_ACTTI|nr:DUF6114 domain-containing protein [Actinoplanes teichomyceticus]TWG24811.1 hypothetical protein FHX34_1021374 [Actinoplanes teichomyceticus]GIF15656.1 hypothetical protein Ate01nite_56880 [Actinoplanes teichomyceticus]